MTVLINISMQPTMCSTQAARSACTLLALPGPQSREEQGHHRSARKAITSKVRHQFHGGHVFAYQVESNKLTLANSLHLGEHLKQEGYNM